MLTAGDIEFEPPMSKIYRFSSTTLPSVVAVWAGDTAAQRWVCDSVSNMIRHDPSKYATVESLAREYGAQLAGHRNEKGAAEKLGTVGLTFDDFMGQQHGLDQEFVLRKWRELESFRLGCEALIIGCDAIGGHIFRVNETGSPDCYDGIGFAAVGSGASHAESEFMFAEYTSWNPIEKALLLAYSAKRRAEVAPGVGKRTFMCVCYGSPQGLSVLDDSHEMIEAIQSQYISAESARRRARDVAVECLKVNLAKFFAPPAATSDPAPAPAPAAPVPPFADHL